MVVRIGPVEGTVRLDLHACIKTNRIITIELALHRPNSRNYRLPYALARHRHHTAGSQRDRCGSYLCTGMTLGAEHVLTQRMECKVVRLPTPTHSSMTPAP